ncbi:YopX family protein [Brevibacillus laterosporus]|uniref:YopX family protein n=1 Tax=Brevibacillus halotolerans TaxID=1507437 RepID=A0ABT4HYI3_9BACL|nr:MULTISPECIES: YopX family protein [Brevibacillus]MCR8986054.1 YopX family protein [Brevibacillus laterosporus]MCZ0831787.1 YopX family protein [Brevibacillus halotolerans]
MREIKFRAWDKEDKNMLDWEMIKLDVEYSLNQLLEMNQFDIMQFTGLYDMYANEVYESDVVKGYYWNAKGRNRIIGVVQYRGNQIVIAGVKQYEGIFVPADPLCEVIGNIYENPELLGVSECER